MTDIGYVALLKGINVGKAKRIAMADLRAMLSGLGYGDVITHLQSGNVALTTTERPGQLVSAIEAGLMGLGLEVRVVVRTRRQLLAAVAADPYAEVADDPAKHLLGFFSAAPGREKVADFEKLVTAKNLDPEVVGRYRIVGDHCYLWCPQGIRNSLFAAVDWDRKLGVSVTMRNWTTALKLIEMTA